MMMRAKEPTFLFDVDITALNNDRIQAELSNHTGKEYGRHAHNRYHIGDLLNHKRSAFLGVRRRRSPK